jgi:serine/threonine/tyrosine protein kinase RAD53
VKLADFGSAGLTNSKGYMKDFAGSPHYIAPEVLARNQQYTSKCDLWSLGVSAFALLTGHYPFNGTSKNDIEKEKLRFNSYERMLISHSARKFVRRLLQKKVQLRYTAVQAQVDEYIRKSKN